MEELGRIGTPAHHVNPARVGTLLVDKARVGQGLGESGAALVHEVRAGLGDFTKHKHFVELAIGHIHDVTWLQRHVLCHVAIFIQGLNIHPVGLTITGEKHVTKIGSVSETAGPVDRFKHCHANIVDGLQARTFHLSNHIDPLAAERDDAHVELDIFDHSSKPVRQLLAQLLNRHVIDVDGASVGIENCAVLGHQGARRLGRAEGTRRDSQLRVVPYDDVDDVAGAEPVVLVLHAGDALDGVFGHGSLPPCRTSTEASLLRFNLLNNELRSNRCDLDVARHCLAALGDRQSHRRLLAHVAGTRARHRRTTTKCSSSQQEHRNRCIATRFANNRLLSAIGTGDGFHHETFVSTNGAPSSAKNAKPRG